MAILIAILVFLIIFTIYHKTGNAVCTSKRHLTGKTALVTGGTAGMGLEIAKDFARRGARVIVACPFENEGKDALQTIITSSGNKNVEFKLLDLSSFESTRRFAADILKSEDRLDILMNNAGIGGPLAGVTQDGLNTVMQVNYYGGCLLSLLLLPLLKKTGTPEEPSRIVNTSSILHKIGRVKVRANYNGFQKIFSYPDSKICLVSFSQEFTNRVRGLNVVMNNVDPGLVGTRIFLTTHKVIGVFIWLFWVIFFKTAWGGAQTALHVALDEEAGRLSGKFFKNCRLDKAIKAAYDDKTAKKLWEETVSILQLTEKELEKCFV